jgi:hypothetical protein
MQICPESVVRRGSVSGRGRRGERQRTGGDRHGARRNGLLNVGVGEDDDGALAAELEGDALEVGLGGSGGDCREAGGTWSVEPKRMGEKEEKESAPALPVATLPVKLILRIRGCSARSLPVSPPPEMI